MHGFGSVCVFFVDTVFYHDVYRYAQDGCCSILSAVSEEKYVIIHDVQVLWILLFPLFLHCSFDGTNALSPIDDRKDGENTHKGVCVPKERLCIENAILTCADSGEKYTTALTESCSWTCLETEKGPRCASASNVLDAKHLCEGHYKVLKIDAKRGEIFLNTTKSSEREEIHCRNHCGDGTQVISALSSVENYAVFCLQELEIKEGASLSVENYDGRPVIFLVDGDVTIDGSIDFSGSNGSADAFAIGGPGGGPGGFASTSDGIGHAPGQGGLAGVLVGGGGGGGALAGNGGAGQVGRDDGILSGDLNGGGGGDGGAMAELIPLLAGSGGGRGGIPSADSLDSGYGGGGGGGSLQISARGVLRMQGKLITNGGDGFMLSDGGGGGGGGSGGSILLEAPVVYLDGVFSVEGGNGGGVDVDGRLGGLGASGSAMDGEKGEGTAEGESGTGGGGGAGHVRINAQEIISEKLLCSSFVSPAICSEGALPQ